MKQRPGAPPPAGKTKRASEPNPAQDSSHNDPKKGDEIDAMLGSIPLVGGVLAAIRLKWGWRAILGLVAGFVVALGLAYAGWLPPRLISEICGTPSGTPSPTPVPIPTGSPSDYELLPNEKVEWDTLVNNARVIRAYGVAWSRLDPRLIVKNVAEGRLKATIVLLDPCSPVTKQREIDEGPSGGTRQSILGQLNKFRRFQTGLKPDEKKQLERSLEISLRGTYPTMNVVTADSDLYAYFCGFGEQCKHSPVLRFKNYVSSPYAQYFARHLDAVLHAEFTQPGEGDKDELEKLKLDIHNEYQCP